MRAHLASTLFGREKSIRSAASIMGAARFSMLHRSLEPFSLSDKSCRIRFSFKLGKYIALRVISFRDLNKRFGPMDASRALVAKHCAFERYENECLATFQ